MELPRIRFHDLRHEHATRLLEAGVHPKIVSQRLGHSSIVVTMDTYSHVSRRWDAPPPTRSMACSGSGGHNLATTTASPDHRGDRSRW